ncbi:MFS transporter [Novosphingobium colocasiae]
MAYTFSYLDRQSLTLLVGPIKASLDISDTHLSLLHGFAFAIFYSILGLPIGRLVDSRKRTRIVAIGIVVWSVMTAACGLARNFTHLFLARVGVGAGEAALSPAAYSLISDSFPARRLPLALSIYNCAIYLGAGLATIIGGAIISAMPATTVPVIGHLEPWQAVFIVIGLPGVLVAALVLTLREPRRTRVKAGAVNGFADTRRYFFAHLRTYGLLMLAASMLTLVWNAPLAWYPTYLMRVFGWTTAEVGSRFGTVILISGVCGVLSGVCWRGGCAAKALPMPISSLA